VDNERGVRCAHRACIGRIKVVGGAVTSNRVAALGRCEVCGREWWLIFTTDTSKVAEVIPVRRE
jgi:hypothetical protein